jgi:hypothetical protein
MTPVREAGDPPSRAGLVWLLYFLGVVALALAVPYGAEQAAWTSSTTEFLQALKRNPYGDPGSFLTGALDVARHGWFTAPNYWIVHLWPPGFMLLEGAAIRLLGEEGPFLVVLLLASAALCATWMLLLRRHLLQSWPSLAATLAPALPFAFPLTGLFLLSPLGLSFGETFSISFFIIGYLLVVRALARESKADAVLAGLALAAAAYFRSQFELIIVFLTLVAVTGLVLIGVAYAWRRVKLVPTATLATVAITLVTAHLAMAPWRIHNVRDAGQLAWVQTSSLIAVNSLATEQTLLAGRAYFVIEGGGHLACKLEPSYCGQTESRYFYKAFFGHPVEWVGEKLQRLPRYWLAPPHPRTLSRPIVAPTGIEIFANLALLACIVASAVRLWQLRRTRVFALQLWFQLSLYACLAGVYTLAHLEARYFYLPKIFGVVTLLLLLATRSPAWAPARDAAVAAGTEQR